DRVEVSRTWEGRCSRCALGETPPECDIAARRCRAGKRSATDPGKPHAGAGAMTACTVSRMKTTTISKLFMACTLGLAFVGCVTDEVAAPQTEAQTSTKQSAVSCTPGAETCDYGCGFDGSQWN